VAVGISAGCVAPPIGSVVVDDVEQKQLNEWGRGAFDQADYERAAALFEESLARAALRDDAVAIQDAAFNLAASKARMRQYAEAREVLRRAHVAIIANPDQLSPDGLLLDGYLAYKLDDLVAARECLRRGLRQPGNLRSAFHVLEAYIRCAEGDVDAARASLRTAQFPPDDRRLVAEKARVLAKIAEREQRYADAVVRYDEAVTVYRAIGHYVAMAESLAAAANAADEAGDRGGAARRWFRAGRSGELQGFPEADDWLRRAIAAAQAASDEAIAEEAAGLLESPPPK
jgi:tetratricopeptide (TPR) repeat protein